VPAVVGNAEVESQHVNEIFRKARPCGRGDTSSRCWVEGLTNTVKQLVALDYRWIVNLGILDQIRDEPGGAWQLLEDYEVERDYEADEDEGV
jgi:hypothetical protein